MQAAEKDGVVFQRDRQADNSVLITANKPCDKIWQYMDDISFKLQKTKIYIKPQGYTWMYDASYGNCQIGLEALIGEKSEYRLGTIFLRNFYTALDYENDLIILGVNTGME